MEAVKGVWAERWWTFKDALRRFGGEARKRTRLAYRILRQGTPLWDELEYRDWDKANEKPAFLDVYDLATNQLLFSVIVWPDVVAGRPHSLLTQRARARVVFEAFQRAAPELASATTWEVDFHPVWNRYKECWVREDMSAYEGPEFPVSEPGTGEGGIT